MRRTFGSFVFCVLLSASAYADNFIYGNNATNGAPYVFKIDKTTGAVVDSYTNLSGQNGRGVVVVGDTMYYTAVSSGSVYSYNLSTHTNNGALFNVAGASSLSTIAYDGTNFIIGDYSGTNKVFFYTPTGSLLNTLSLGNCTGNCDGLEYFQNGGTGYLIENRGDAEDPYDVYDLSGNLVTSGLIKPTNNNNTGIAFDGTYFYTSDIFTGKLNEFDISGNPVQAITITGAPAGFSPLIEDLSADYSQVIPVGPTPEPGTFVLLGTGLLGVAARMRKRLS